MSIRSVTPHLTGELIARAAGDGDPVRPPRSSARRMLGLHGLPPWTPAEQLGLIVSTAAGAAGLLCCWAFAAGNISWGQRLQWLTGAVVALIVAGVGDGIWLLHGHRALRRHKQLLVQLVDASPVAGGRGLGPPTEATTTVRCSGARMTRYHLPGCMLVAGRDVTSAPIEEHVRAGRSRCEICGS